MATKDTNPSSSRSGDAITPGEWVRYDQLERKETRLRPDQYNSLSELSRGLNRQRHGRGERITEKFTCNRERIDPDTVEVRATSIWEHVSSQALFLALS